jgi:hypothetical protein
MKLKDFINTIKFETSEEGEYKSVCGKYTVYTLKYSNDSDFDIEVTGPESYSPVVEILENNKIDSLFLDDKEMDIEFDFTKNYLL